jgi:hypothetical protein
MSAENLPNSKTDSAANGDCRPVPCSPFVVFGEGRDRVAIHRDRITMVHDEVGETLLKLDMGSGNFEPVRRLKMPFAEVMEILANSVLYDSPE